MVFKNNDLTAKLSKQMFPRYRRGKRIIIACKKTSRLNKTILSLCRNLIVHQAAATTKVIFPQPRALKRQLQTFIAKDKNLLACLILVNFSHLIELI